MSSPPSSVTLSIPARSLVFDGHFPGDPVLPGALLLDLVMRAMTAAGALPSRAGCEVAVAKFSAAVRPGDSMTIRWQPVRGVQQFECRVAELIVASGSIRPPPGGQ